MGYHQSFLSFLVCSQQTSLFPVYVKTKNDVLKMMLPLELLVGITISSPQNKNRTISDKSMHTKTYEREMCPADYFPCHLLPSPQPLTPAFALIRPYMIKATDLPNLFWYYSSPSSFMFIAYTQVFPTSGPLQVLIFLVGKFLIWLSHG